MPFWVYRKRIQYYVEYVDSDECEETFCGELPPVLLICDSPILQRRVQRYLRRVADSIDEDELKFLVTNRKLLHEANGNDAIWTAVGEDKNETVRLAEVS